MPNPQHTQLHAALADCRRQLQANQQSINEIVATAVQRISSTERLQLLQLLVRGKFLEVMNEELSTELGLRRSLLQAAMAQGALPPALMNEAKSTESWFSEHRALLDFHGQMSKMEMGGSLRAPSIAQLLDQNLISSEEATASQNLGELVRPFTNNQSRGSPILRAGNGPQRLPASPPQGTAGSTVPRDVSRPSVAPSSAKLFMANMKHDATLSPTNEKSTSIILADLVSLPRSCYLHCGGAAILFALTKRRACHFH